MKYHTKKNFYAKENEKKIYLIRIFLPDEFNLKAKLGVIYILHSDGFSSQYVFSNLKAIWKAPEVLSHEYVWRIREDLFVLPPDTWIKQKSLPKAWPGAFNMAEWSRDLKAKTLGKFIFNSHVMVNYIHFFKNLVISCRAIQHLMRRYVKIPIRACREVELLFWMLRYPRVVTPI